MAQDEGVVLAERALQAAMVASDVEQLDRLLHPELLAVGPDGQLISKVDDLAAHRSGLLDITEARELELRVIALGNLALTFVVLHLRGTVGDTEVSGSMRYTRTWTRDGGAWRVIGAHISPATQ